MSLTMPAGLATTVPRTRWHAAVLLIRPLAKAIDWGPLALVTAFVGGLLSLTQAGQPLSGQDALLLMRVAGTLLGSAAAFALVDAMSADLGAAAVPRWVRQSLRCLLAGGAAVAIWLAAFAYALTRLPDGALFPVGDLLIEMAACLGIALAAAATAVRHAPGRQAAMAAVVVQLGLVLATILLPDQVRLWPPTCGFGYWDQAHQLWLALLPIPYAWLALALRDLRR
ncbi:unnamed protein product [[Actinomadura] parvosata subsp. kistnae]|uniref:ABC transporter n=1 Tax=[Actinomadura] parvosata subsp. kistnae TaxID=1909395 RepID=A0A1V0AE16_9ACTN|nr:hypothetical protein [Nonomuraea sp. ATCC 55076]AQZ68464.1 hypothetical protein BKM31_49600 [Nonomuraea sp. ATCC 55076]SPL93085.1 unnamed protein product [Actinomadura parvosata subsp. kistnae]